tara:strand:+ start:2384 stop:2707 length:324 start_codon:yes stop_codon:yes gene_type:complete
MVCWPCLLKLQGDDELIYLAAEPDFITECRDLIVTDEDYVIDCTGLSFLIKPSLIGIDPVLVNAKQLFSREQVTVLIRAHEFSKAQLCLTKIYFLTVADAIKSLATV